VTRPAQSVVSDWSIVLPFQGLAGEGIVVPGRCPRLSCLGPVGAALLARQQAASVHKLFGSRWGVTIVSGA
jgi:hypothetical protein